ncbi:MAG: FAD-dependent monooxygenase [Alphaproteobacteria bacterium]|nr:FAD-dependent monooxygenase [Alphaproteobacteria bacterium]
MTKILKIAVIGSGTAGLAAAAQLKKDGHDTQIFERFEEPKPLGAGLLLQPTGLACLAKLGLDDKALQYGAQINNLYGRSANGTVVFDISYRNLKPHYFGLGIHRGALFTILYDEVLRLNIPIQTGCEIIDTNIQNDQRFITDRNSQEYGPFDLLIDASGMRSPLRKHGQIKLEKPYPYGAVWGVLEDPDQKFGTDYLQQRYDGAHVMIGMLAIGSEPHCNKKKCTFFWSLPPGGYEAWLDAGLDAWKKRVIDYWPEMEPFLHQFKKPDDLTFAQYSDIIMKRWHEDRLVFIGDAAHNTSPQLGQGANLGLADALVLSETLAKHADINAALGAYTKARKKHIYFYQIASRWLTPFFQSHYKLAGLIRDLSFGLLCKMPYVKTEMLRTLAGLKTGLFTHMNPGDWHKKYDLKKA